MKVPLVITPKTVEFILGTLMYISPLTTITTSQHKTNISKQNALSLNNENYCLELLSVKNALFSTQKGNA